MSETDDGIIQEFLTESYENLERLDRDFVTLETDPHSRDTLASVFRTIHTLKGTCGFLGFRRLEAVAHAGESLLARLRSGELFLTPTITTVMLRMVDAVRAMLATIESTRGDGDQDHGALIAALQRATTGETARAAKPTKAVKGKGTAGTKEKATAGAGGRATAGAKAAADAPDAAPALEVEADADAPGESDAKAAPARHQGMFENLIRAGRLERESVELAARLQLHGDPRRIGEILVDLGVLQPDDVLQALKEQSELPGRSAVTASASVRVDVALLERLMNRVGELVLARNQLLLLATGQDPTALAAAAQRLSLITTELQEAIMKTRMQPIRTLWGRMPRLVRDLATACGKQVHLEMVGNDTELDRSVIEAIKDPLTHLVRNALDHGIEVPAARVAAGKPADGVLRMRAYHESGQVHIEVVDDGAGIDVARIRVRALERGLVPLDHADHMTDSEWLNLIFLPGFSTAEKVTNISGRGVGMDVVKSNLERIGGTVEIESRPGAGTTMKIKIPLTLAIIPALRVLAGGDDYAIPQANLIELLRLRGEAARRALEHVHDAPVYRLRGRLLPLVFLNQRLGLAPAAAPGEARGGPGSASQELHIVVLHADGILFGLVVDAIGDTREIIVKPLGQLLGHIATYAGATILGDGRVALILDVSGLARSAGIARDRSRLSVMAGPRPTVEHTAALRLPLLVFEVREGWRCAAPLRSIVRIERFETRSLERVGDREVVQYRREIVPVLPLADLLETDRASGPGGLAGRPEFPALVCVHAGRTVALAVERIVDLEELVLAPGQDTSPTGVAASFVVGGRVTDLLDLDALLARVPGDRLTPPAAAASGAGS